MRLGECIRMYTDAKFLSAAESRAAYDEFMKNIPGRVLEYEFDETKTSKHGITRGEEVYKFGVSLEDNMVFLEYYENRNQGRATLGMYIDRIKPSFTVKGTKVEKDFLLVFTLENGAVKKLSKLK